eukprot:Rmarinus@m.22437
MDLTLHRQDLVNVSTTNKKTLCVLPLSSKKKIQKVAVGDNSGVVQVFSVKKGAPVVAFKSLPEPKEINRVTLGGTRDTADKIFYTTGRTIKAMTKKGKGFYSHETNMTEDIQHICVEGTTVWAAGPYVYTKFQDDKDIEYYLVNDVVNDMVVEYVADDSRDAVLGCNDRYVRVLHGGKLYYEAAVDGPVISLTRYPSSQLSKKGREIIYGTGSGHFGIVNLQKVALQPSWCVKPDANTAGVTATCAGDFTADGVPDVLIGRQDGSVELYSFDLGEGAPSRVFHDTVSEGVQSIDHGHVLSASSEDVILSTYSGKVLAFTHGGEGALDDDIRKDSKKVEVQLSKSNKGRAKKVKALRQELDVLQRSVREKKDIFSRKAQGAMPAVSQYRVSHRFDLNSDDATYMLSVEMNAPLDCLVMHGSLFMDLLDTQANAGIISRTPSAENEVLATCRWSSSTHRAAVRVRTVEGSYGTLHVYVVPALEPKMCQVVECNILPLSLHRRIDKNAFSTDPPPPLNEMKLSGQFSFTEIHSWVYQCIPEVPKNTSADDVTYYFQSTFFHTVLMASIRPAEAIFRSDSLTTLSILKDFITEQATEKNKKISISYKVDDNSVPHMLNLIHPKLQYQFSLSKKVDAINGLKELSMQEEDVSFLSDELKNVLENAEHYQKEFEHQPRTLQFLFNVVVDLFIAKHKFKGQNFKNKIPQLRRILDSYTFDTLLNFFASG